MATQSIDLGRVNGLSLYEVWAAREENQDKTWEDFLAEMAALGISIDKTDAVEAGNPAVVTSRGVYEKLASLGLFDGSGNSYLPQEPTSLTLDIKQYQLGDDLSPTGGIDVSDWIDSASGVDGTWTLSPDIGQEWFVRNGAATNKLLVSLPQSAPVGAVVKVYFLPSSDVGEVEVPTIEAGGVVLFDMERPEHIGGVLIVAEHGPIGWNAVLHYAEADESLVIQSASVVYNGANRSGTASLTHTSVASWTGTGTGSVVLRTDIFRKLYNVAPLDGWATSADGEKVYEDGATVSGLEAGSVLTLYPVYTATQKPASGGFSFSVNGTMQHDRIYCDDGEVNSRGSDATDSATGTVMHSVNEFGKGTNKYTLTLNPKAVMPDFSESEVWVVFGFGQTPGGTGISRTFSFTAKDGNGEASDTIVVPNTKGYSGVSDPIKFTGFSSGAAKEWYVSASGSSQFINAGLTVIAFLVR